MIGSRKTPFTCTLLIKLKIDSYEKIDIDGICLLPGDANDFRTGYHFC